MTDETFREQTRASRYQQKFSLPPKFDEVLKAFTREVLRSQPVDIYEWSANYFKDLALAEDGMEVNDSTARPPMSKDLQALSTQLQDAFGEYDTDRLGRLYPHLMKRVLMESTGLSPTQALFVLSHPEVSVEADGTVDYRKVGSLPDVVEQVAFLQRSGHDFEPADSPTVHGLEQGELQSELKAVFHAWDTTGTGRVALGDYCTALRQCPLQLTERDIRLLSLEASVDGDGSVPYVEFVSEKAFGLTQLAKTFTDFEAGA